MPFAYLDRNETVVYCKYMRKTFLLFAIFFIAAFGFLQSKTPAAQEPLADPLSLSKLIQGEQVPQPQDEHYAEFHGEMIDPPALATIKQTNRVLGTTSPADKRIEVDLSAQRVYAFEGNKKIFDFLVSTGKWGATPTGTFRIWVKVRSQLMSGGKKELGTYYYLPNVPWVQFFYNNEIAKYRGYSLHGTYWHNNFGHPMSHGCINMRIADAALLYDWAEPPVTNPKAWATYPTAERPGTEVVIYGVAPKG